VNWDEIVEGKIKTEQRRAIAEWKAMGRTIARPV
jgi:hypothetical protein